MLTVAEAAEKLNISESRVRALIKAGLLFAEKHGRQWLIYEKSVEERLAKGGNPGRPWNKSQSTVEINRNYIRAFSLYQECQEVLAQGGIASLIQHATTQEEREFYVTVSNYFLAKKCDELVAKGVY